MQNSGAGKSPYYVYEADGYKAGQLTDDIIALAAEGEVISVSGQRKPPANPLEVRAMMAEIQQLVNEIYLAAKELREIQHQSREAKRRRDGND